MLNLVARARRRLFCNELASQGANAAIAFLTALILLLLAGTQLLDARWLLPVSVAAAGIALYRSRRRRLSLYAAAQVVDRRLDLADTISTAVYFQQDGRGRMSPQVRQMQLARAQDVCGTVDVRRAVPYAWPRSIYLLLILVLVAGSLFALRYGLMGRLDLKPPLARIFGPQFGAQERPDVARNNRRKPPQLPGEQKDERASTNDPDQNPQMQPDTASPDGTNSASDPGADKNGSNQGNGKKDGNRNAQAQNGAQEAQAEKDAGRSGENQGEGSNKQDQKQSSGKPEGNHASESSSLMNKAKDMLQNLLSSIKPQQNTPANQQSKDANPQQSQAQQNKSKNGQPQSGQKGEQQDGQQGEQAQDQQDPSQQANGKSESQQNNKQSGSGAGNQDGDKRIKQAEDLAAMGKITEILGKRSAAITGEATVEVKATDQQLKTAYTQSGAQHGQSSGQIDRDEVPVAMQPYVQEYFKQARKTPPTVPAKKQ